MAAMAEEDEAMEDLQALGAQPAGACAGVLPAEWAPARLEAHQVPWEARWACSRRQIPHRRSTSRRKTRTQTSCLCRAWAAPKLKRRPLQRSAARCCR